MDDSRRSFDLRLLGETIAKRRWHLLVPLALSILTSAVPLARTRLSSVGRSIPSSRARRSRRPASAFGTRTDMVTVAMLTTPPSVDAIPRGPPQVNAKMSVQSSGGARQFRRYPLWSRAQAFRKTGLDRMNRMDRMDRENAHTPLSCASCSSCQNTPCLFRFLHGDGSAMRPSSGLVLSLLLSKSPAGHSSGGPSSARPTPSRSPPRHFLRRTLGLPLARRRPLPPDPRPAYGPESPPKRCPNPIPDTTSPDATSSPQVTCYGSTLSAQVAVRG